MSDTTNAAISQSQRHLFLWARWLLLAFTSCSVPSLDRSAVDVIWSSMVVTCRQGSVFVPNIMLMPSFKVSFRVNTTKLANKGSAENWKLQRIFCNFAVLLILTPPPANPSFPAQA